MTIDPFIPMSCDLFFFFYKSATTEIYTLSLHDALPILNELNRGQSGLETYGLFSNLTHDFLPIRSEERFSRNAETDLVCRLLLEKKNNSFNNAAFVRSLQRIIPEVQSEDLITAHSDVLA